MTLPFTGSRLPEINDLWNLAARDEHFADLLRLPFADRAAGSLLMLHREELFPTIRFPQQKGFDHITAQYIPWLSQTLQKTSRCTQRLFLNPVTHSRYQRAHAAFDQFNAIIQDSARDRFALAGLKFIKNSPGFLRVLEDGKPIDYGVLKSTLRNYEDVDASESIAELLEGVETVAKGAQSAELLHQAANGIDLFLDMFLFLGDAVQIEFARYLCHHHAQLLELTGVAEGELRRVVLALHHSGFLGHSGPCLLFCGRCPDGGLVGSLRGGIMNRRVRCPLCGRVAVCVSALHVADALQRSILQSDGFLGTATGWQLTERELPFCHSYRNKVGEEIDFLVEQPGGIMIIECKMHKLRGASLPDELAKDLAQLRDHLKVAAKESIPVATAMCLVNLSAKALNELIPIVAGSASCAVKADELRTLVHSYQNFPATMDLSCSSAANHELVVRLACS
jgi:hypothetical protein